MSNSIQNPSTPGEMDRYWDDDEVDHFITSEAHTATKTPEQFKETHVDINRIYADTLTPIGVSGDFVTQEDILESITASKLDDPNRIFIVRGEPGSGKSQLCEWTKYQINGYGDDDDGIEDYVALHVSRSQTRMDQIINVLTEPLDVDPNVQNIDDLDPQDAASAIVEYMRGIWSTEHFTDPEVRELTEKRGGQSDLRAIFAKNIQEYQDALESRDEHPDFNLLTRSDFRDLRLQVSFSSKLNDNQDLLYSVLKNEAHEYLSRNLVGDFKEQLQEYSQRYQEQGIRPVLICEDLTTFSVLKEQLLDHIFELGSSHYDIVLGWTIGWEQDNIDDAMARSDAATYMKGRSEGYLTMTNENGEAYFLDDDASVELTRSYLNAIKRHSQTGNTPDQVEEAFNGLYPFNERFIQIAYRQLNDEGSDRKTPRLLLLRVVKHCLKSNLQPYEAMKSNSFVDRPMLDIDSKYHQIYQDISRWYGLSLEDGVGVKTGIFEAFGVPLPTEEVDVRDGYVVFNKGQWSDIKEKINPDPPEHEVEVEDEPEGEGDVDVGEDKEEDEERENDDDNEEEEITPVKPELEPSGEERERRRKVQEFQDWVTNGEKFPSSDTLHSGAVEALERWHNPTRLANPNASTRSASAIFYARGDNVPVSIQGDQQRQANIDIELQWGPEYADLYTPMLEYGLLGTFDTTDTNFDQLRAWADTNVAQFKQDMREEIEDCLPTELTIEKTLVLGQFFLINAAKGKTIEDGKLPAGLVFEDYEHDRPYGKPIVDEFDHDSAFGEAFSRLGKSSTVISDLIEGFFLLKSNVVDYERLAEARQEIASDFQTYVDDAMMIDAGDLADAYKIGSTRNQANTKVSTLLSRISDYAAELQRLTADEDASNIQDALKPVERWYDSSHTVEDLSEWFESLYNCAGTLDVTMGKSYEDALSTLTESPEEVKLTAFGDDVDVFQQMDGTTGTMLVALLHDFARSRHEQEAWKIYEAFDSLISDLQKEEHSTGSDLEHRIKELTQYSEYEQKRQEVLGITEDL
jgi:hypothetical protein